MVVTFENKDGKKKLMRMKTKINEVRNEQASKQANED